MVFEGKGGRCLKNPGLTSRRLAVAMPLCADHWYTHRANAEVPLATHCPKGPLTQATGPLRSDAGVGIGMLRGNPVLSAN